LASRSLAGSSNSQAVLILRQHTAAGLETLARSTHDVISVDLGEDPGATPLPLRFFGAWERRELIVDGVAVANAGLAVWVQAGDWFVDVRGHGGFASDTCFAGTTTWEAPFLTWAHPIDRHPGGDGVDRGHITFDGENLIEEGDFIAGASRAYRERWCPAVGARAPLFAATSADGIAVRAGDHAAVVVDRRADCGGFAAEYSRLRAGEWEIVIAISDGGGAPIIAPLGGDHELPDDWRYHDVADA
jgi:hypothetical protein